MLVGEPRLLSRPFPVLSATQAPSCATAVQPSTSTRTSSLTLFSQPEYFIQALHEPCFLISSFPAQGGWLTPGSGGKRSNDFADGTAVNGHRSTEHTRSPLSDVTQKQDVTPSGPNAV